jgi:uncharacterized protein
MSQFSLNMGFFKIAVRAALSALCLMAFTNQAQAGCNPCICGGGGGLPPPAGCSGGRGNLGSPSRGFPAPTTPVRAGPMPTTPGRGGPVPVPPMPLNASLLPVNPCENVSGWRQEVCVFARENLKHSAWGYEHSLRDYTLAKIIGAASSLTFDDDVLFAAAMTHDMGGFSPYESSGIDHALRSTQVVEPVLLNAGFPAEKIEQVKSAMINHSYYDATKPATTEGVLLHDADALDFLGSMSAVRILAVVGHEPNIPTVKKAIAVLESLYTNAPKHIYSGWVADQLVEKRALELRTFLDTVADESYGFGIPQ